MSLVKEVGLPLSIMKWSHAWLTPNRAGTERYWISNNRYGNNSRLKTRRPQQVDRWAS